MGMSSRPNYEAKPADEILDDFVESVEEFRKAIGFDNFYLVGHSLGGYISIGYCLKYQFRVKKLFCISPVFLIVYILNFGN